MSIQVTSLSYITVVETYTQFSDPSDATVTFNGMNTDDTLNASSMPPVTLHAIYSKALSGGVATIDLTAVPVNGQAGITQSFSGLKLQRVKFTNPSTNANPITVTFGAANPYLLGGTGWKIILQPGESWTYEGLDTSPDVAGGAKNIDLAGTASQALNVQFVAG